MNAPRTQPWLESLGDWAWPGRGSGADTLHSPPSWVPTSPPRLEPAIAGAGGGSVPLRARATPRRLLLAFLLSALAAVCAALALKGSLTVEGLLGTRAAAPPEVAEATAPETPLGSLPRLIPVSQDAAGSSIEGTSFTSAALSGEGSFLVYLPPGFHAGAYHYPVLYLLHGQQGHDTAFLEVGLQPTLDRLIEQGAVPPMIAVMIQDAPWLNNWQNVGGRHSASYVVEVQELVDQMLPTIGTRGGRAIAGNSKGGFGAMHVALDNPYRFSVAESWLGYFDGLGGELRVDAPIVSRLGLHAFLYGAVGDTAADPGEDPAFAAKLRAAGAQAESAVYPGNHSLTTVGEHLESMLLFAGRSLREAELREADEQARSLRSGVAPASGAPAAG
jgi:enterochelin esterase-like enzyme